MVRRFALALCLLASLVVIIPLVSSTAHNLRSHFAASSHHRRHSRAWWRRHRRMMRRRQALLARRRALLMARRNGTLPSVTQRTVGNHTTAPAAPAMTVETVNSVGLPNGWSSAGSTDGATTFRIAPVNGVEGRATLSVVAPTTGPQPFGREQRLGLGPETNGYRSNDQCRWLGGKRSATRNRWSQSVRSNRPDTVRKWQA
jgi:hypothetical protein